jgi:hypothetical protein
LLGVHGMFWVVLWTGSANGVEWVPVTSSPAGASQQCSSSDNRADLIKHATNQPNQPPTNPTTHRSGVTAFLDSSVGYPLPIDGLVPAAGEWWFRGLSWAQPSVAELRRLMRHVYVNREEAAAKGAAARARMVERYSPPAVARLLLDEFRRIEGLLPQL